MFFKKFIISRYKKGIKMKIDLRECRFFSQHLKDATRYCQKNGYDKNKNETYKIGDIVSFWGGYNEDIRYTSEITGFDKDCIYVAWDCHWYPVKDDVVRGLAKVLK